MRLFHGIPFNIFSDLPSVLAVLSALQSIRTSIHPIPERYPAETIVVRPTGEEEQGKTLPLVTVPHGGPHGAATTAFTAATTALALEGCTFFSI